MKHLKGIYAIEHMISGRVYIGSTSTSFEKRWKEHCRMLNAGKHTNRHLQRAWAKYGADAFVFRVLEAVEDVPSIEGREAHWLSRYLQMQRPYNIIPVSRSNIKLTREPRPENVRAKITAALRGKVQPRDVVERRAQTMRGRTYSAEHRAKVSAALAKTYDGFIAPDGAEHRNICNLSRFCAEHGLITGNMRKVYSGERHEHRGWRRVDRTHTPKTFSLIAPDGTRHEGIANLRAFCDLHSLDYASVLQMVSQRTALHSHRGWYHPDRPPPTRCYAFTAPDGTRREGITHLGDFCRAHGLLSSKMSQVFNGTRPRHKGWTL